VVQPLMSGGLAILAVFSHFYLDERLRTREWLAVGVTGLGIVGLGISTEEEPQTPHIIPFRITVRPDEGRPACRMRCEMRLDVHEKPPARTSWTKLPPGQAKHCGLVLCFVGPVSRCC